MVAAICSSLEGFSLNTSLSLSPLEKIKLSMLYIETYIYMYVRSSSPHPHHCKDINHSNFHNTKELAIGHTFVRSRACIIAPRYMVVYLEIQSERANDKATLVKLLARLYQTFIVELGQKWLITVGDAKIFNVIHSIKEDYGEHFNWVLPFPRDWHTLLNYQKALMKAYADAGLTHLGKSSGHRSETLTSLINCSNFKRTHYFLIQVMASLTHFFLDLYKATIQ